MVRRSSIAALAGLAALAVAACPAVGETSIGRTTSSGVVTVRGGSVAVLQLVVDPSGAPGTPSGSGVVASVRVRVRANVAWQVIAEAPDPGAPVLFEVAGGSGGPAPAITGGPTASTVLLVRSDRPDGLAGVALRIAGMDGD